MLSLSASFVGLYAVPGMIYEVWGHRIGRVQGVVYRPDVQGNIWARVTGNT